MSPRNWINKLKLSDTARARLAAVGERARGSWGWTRGKFSSLGARFPKERIADVWTSIKETSMKSDSIRTLVEKSQSALQTRWDSFKEALPTNFPRKLEDLKNVQPQELAEGLTKVFRQSNLGASLRVGAVVAAAYFLADTAALFTDSLIPDAPPIPAPTMRARNEKRRSVDEYAAIMGRNIFSSAGIIPDDMLNADPNGPARKSNLALNLVGTVVLADEIKSIAAIEDKAANKIIPVRINENMESKITIKKIEHLKVTFINNQNGALEYIEIPEDVLNRLNVRPSAVSKGGPIEREGETHFAVQKTELDKAFGNLNEVLTQARAIPNFENGVPNGYKIIQIVPGSIYTKLGIGEGDILQGVNGEPISDPGKAFQLMNELRSGSGHVEITVKSPDGKIRTQTYDIK